MVVKIRSMVSALVILSLLQVHALAVKAPERRSSMMSALAGDLTGRWRVKFTLSGLGENELLFDSQAKGSGTFLLIDGAAKTSPSPQRVIWSTTSNDRVSFSGDIELQLVCCREMGTLIFKGKFETKDLISGKAIFIGSTIDEENFNGFRSTVGTFTASRLPK